MYVVVSLWFKFVETDLPSDKFKMTALGCRSLVRHVLDQYISLTITLNFVDCCHVHYIEAEWFALLFNLRESGNMW